MQQQKPKLIAIVGPTASGKTALSIVLAKWLKKELRLACEIVSADSRQVYRGLDLGTGKVTAREMAGVPHHLLNVSSPKRRYSASNFNHDATRAVRGILARNRLPLAVGGTGFYIDTLLGRMRFPDVAPNEALRAALAERSPEELYQLLAAKDPARAAVIEKENPRRLVRALEIAEALGATPQGGPALEAESDYDTLWLGCTLPETELKEKIRARLRSRMRRGMLAEAHQLHARGLSYHRMEELGLEYAFMARYLKGELTKEEMAAQLEAAIGQYAKRQLRWFKRNQSIHWVSTDAEAFALALSFLRA